MTALRRSARGTAVAILALGVLGCANLKLISDYDERIDAETTAFERRVDFFLISMKSDSGKPQTRYENRMGFYDSLRVDLNLLRVRAEATPKNEKTVAQIGGLQQAVDVLEKLHKSYGGIPPSQIPPIQSGIDVACGAILKLELAKKRGETGPPAN